MITFPEEWRTADVELRWYRTEVGRKDEFWSDVRGMVWGRKSHYCAAMVWVKDKEFCISTLGLRGLTTDEQELLEMYLESLGLTRMAPCDVPQFVFSEIGASSGRF